MEFLTTAPRDVTFQTCLLGLAILLVMWVSKTLCSRGTRPTPDTVADGCLAGGGLDSLVADTRRALADLLEATLTAVQEGVGHNMATAVSNAFEEKLAPTLKSSLEKWLNSLGKTVNAIPGLVKEGFAEAKQGLASGLENLTQQVTLNQSALLESTSSILEKIVDIGKSFNGHVAELRKHLGGMASETLHLIKPMPGMVVAVKNLSEKCAAQAEEAARVMQEIRTPVIECSTLCLDNRQILQRTREELAALADKVVVVQGKLDSLLEAMEKLSGKVQPPPPTAVQATGPTSTPPTMPTVQPVHFSIADHLAVPGPQQMPPPQQTLTSPSPEMLLQQAVWLLQQRRH